MTATQSEQPSLLNRVRKVLSMTPVVPTGKKVAYELNVSEELDELLSAVADDSDTDKADIIRRAIALYLVAVNAKKQGQHLAIVKPTDEIEAEITGY